MSIKKDEIGYYRLETPSKKPFIATCVQKKHVGLYSVVMYRHPQVIPKELEDLRIGKSCMGFVDFDESFDLILNCLTISSSIMRVLKNSEEVKKWDWK